MVGELLPMKLYSGCGTTAAIYVDARCIANGYSQTLFRQKNPNVKKKGDDATLKCDLSQAYDLGLMPRSSPHIITAREASV